MTEQAKPSELLAKISLPTQELSQLSFCKSNKPSAVQKWVDGLRATQVMQTSIQLYNAVPEIPQLKTDFANRLEILENLRTTIQYSLQGLQKNFLNQPLTLPEEAQKAALIAQSIQKNMVDGYIVTAIQITQQRKAKKQILALLATAIHRAITGIGLLFFRCYQIYTQTPPNLWSTLHILYQVAEYYHLSEQTINDSTLSNTHALSIRAAYTRILMLATAKTNQLNQNDINTIFTLFENWCVSVKLHDKLTEDNDNFFVVDLNGNQAPIYKSKVEEKHTQHFIELDFKSLLNQLSKQSSATENTIGSSSSVQIPKDFPEPLLKHLLETWGNITQRKQDRRNIEGAADACIGLIDCHFFISNSQEFNDFLSNISKHEANGIHGFSQGITPASHLNDANNNIEKPFFRINVKNTSLGGYCVLWTGNIPNKAVAGELIGIKEIGKRTWDIGVIRWVRQLKKASQLGIKLLSNKAKPCAIAQTYDMGGCSEYMRTLLLPPSKLTGGSPSLLTGTVPFQALDNVRIADGDKEWAAKLDRVLFSTKSVQQFRFRALDHPNNEGKDIQHDTDDINSSWDDI